VIAQSVIAKNAKIKIKTYKKDTTKMLETLLWISIGAFIGWNFPQPSYAKTLQEKYLQTYIDKLKVLLFFWK
jgi:hypothetical protein